jgi:hypothetical protein
VIQKQRWRLRDCPARKRRLTQKDLKSATIHAAPSQDALGPVEMRLWERSGAESTEYMARVKWNGNGHGNRAYSGLDGRIRT